VAEATDRDQALQIREQAIEARERAADARDKASRWGNPTFLALLAAIVALVGNLFVSFYNNRTLHDNEKSQEQSNLILQAIKTGNNPIDSCKNLVFFANVGLLDDSDETIRKQCRDNPTSAPTLPASSPFDSSASQFASGGTNNEAASTVRGIVVDDAGVAIQGAEVSLADAKAVGSNTAKTDEHGKFEFHLTTPIHYGVTIRVEKPGHMHYRTTFLPSLNEIYIEVPRLPSSLK
jgi:Carboxypeptidase regulatory-like domain